MLDGDGSTLNSSHRNIAISSTYRPGFSVRWSHSASSIRGVMLGGRPAGTGGALAVPNNRKFLRIWVTERSVHFALPAICAVVNFFLLCIIWTIISRCQDSRFRAICGVLFGWWCLVEMNDITETKETIFRVITVQYGLLFEMCSFCIIRYTLETDPSTKVTIYGLVNLGI